MKGGGGGTFSFSYGGPCKKVIEKHRASVYERPPTRHRPPVDLMFRRLQLKAVSCWLIKALRPNKATLPS